MTQRYLYPGVYIEEIPSSVRPITGVSTSDTAFIDVFSSGAVNRATRVANYGDFERIFGGLNPASEASYAIRQYFLNGGSAAWVVRVTAANAIRAMIELEQDDTPGTPALRVSALNAGYFGNRIEVAVLHAVDPLFDLYVREVEDVNGRVNVLRQEWFEDLNLNNADGANFVQTKINGVSTLITVTALINTSLPDANAPTGTEPRDRDYVRLMGGSEGSPTDAELLGNPNTKTGMYALDDIAPFVFNLMCIPAAARLAEADMINVITTAQAYCEQKRAFYIVDMPATLDTQTFSQQIAALDALIPTLEAAGVRSTNAALYYPRISVIDPLNNNQPRGAGASGVVAGIYARTDATRGVWKAPAGTEAALRNVTLRIKLNDDQNGTYNQQGINILRTFPVYGNVVWGARTLDGADVQSSPWKYIPVRRTALFIEESLFQSLKWVVFEPNDEPLWSQIRLNVGAFMQNLFRRGAFQGSSPNEAYLVKCDSETTTQTDIDSGIVNIIVGFAPLKPAEFVVIRLQQLAGQSEA